MNKIKIKVLIYTIIPLIVTQLSNIGNCDEIPNMSYVSDPVITFSGSIPKEIQNNITKISVLSDSNIAYINVFKFEELENNFIIEYSVDKYSLWNILIVDSELNILFKSNWIGDNTLSNPYIIDIDKDGYPEIGVNIEYELSEEILIFRVRNNEITLIFNSPEFETLVEDTDTKQYIANSYKIENIDNDPSLEIKFKYIDIDSDRKLEKDVIYKLKDGKYILLNYKNN